jgi:hypothetical protein
MVDRIGAFDQPIYGNNDMKVFASLFGFILITLISTSALAHRSCKITEQDGSGEGAWCQSHNQEGTIRCYAQVKYSDGEEKKIWGDNCYSSFSDCWSSGKGDVEPKCST